MSYKSFADLRWAVFSAQMLIRKINFSVTSKLSAKYETSFIVNVVLATVLLCPQITTVKNLHRSL